MAYDGKVGKYGLCFDTETSGVSRGTLDLSEGCQVVSLGAIVVDLMTYEPVDTLYVEVKWNGTSEWAARAQEVHGLSREHLEEHGVTEEEAAIMLLQLVAKWFGSTQVMPICHKPKFDIDFVNRLTSVIDCQIPWSSVWVDTAALGACLIDLVGSDAIFDAMGFEARTGHNSFEDAYMTLQAAKTFREIFAAGLTNR